MISTFIMYHNIHVRLFWKLSIFYGLYSTYAFFKSGSGFSVIAVRIFFPKCDLFLMITENKI